MRDRGSGGGGGGGGGNGTRPQRGGTRLEHDKEERKREYNEEEEDQKKEGNGARLHSHEGCLDSIELKHPLARTWGRYYLGCGSVCLFVYVLGGW